MKIILRKCTCTLVVAIKVYIKGYEDTSAVFVGILFSINYLNTVCAIGPFLSSIYNYKIQTPQLRCIIDVFLSHTITIQYWATVQHVKQGRGFIVFDMTDFAGPRP